MSLSVMPSSLSLKWEGATSTLTVNGASDLAWDYSNEKKWCKVTKTGKNTVSVTAEKTRQENAVTL